jgi:hypothetical protein
MMNNELNDGRNEFSLPEGDEKLENELAQASEPVNEAAEESEVLAKNEVVEVDETQSESVPQDIPNDDEDESDEESENDTSEEIQPVDLHSLSKEQLVIRLKTLFETIPVTSRNLRDEVFNIRNTFYEILSAENEALREAFFADGGEEKDFKPPVEPQELLLKEFFDKYNHSRNEMLREAEKQYELNYLAKLDVIEEIKSLIGKEESLQNTFRSFHDLQRRWKEIGQVTKAKAEGLYESYHHTVDMFYDYVKINKDLRDLDFKKNMEAKLKICERAESLDAMEDFALAFAELQELHKEWREIGPVAPEFKESLWERFKEATAAINKKHQQHFEDVKNQQKENLDKKIALCEKVEEIASVIFERPKMWNKKGDEIIEIQKQWRAIGFAPRKFNNKVYERFRAACDKFFENKRQFYVAYKKEQEDNLEKKRQLLERAQELVNSSDWKKATDEFVKIQKEWKEIGAVPRKHSDVIWEKFRGVCDDFFKRKKEFFKDIDSVHVENLKKKKQIIEQLNALEFGENNDENIKLLQDLREQWNAIGHVPFKEKDAVYNEFRNALNKHFDKLDMDSRDKELEKFRSRMEDFKDSGRNRDKMDDERNKLFIKLRALESEIAVLENNIGFLSGGKNKANALIRDYELKIENAKERLEILKRKIDLIDDIN